MPKRQLFSVMLVLFSLVIILPVPSHADFYKYKAANGTIAITNELDKVPPQYRSRVKVIKEGAPTTPVPAPAPAPITAPQETQGAAKQDVAPTTPPVAAKEGWLARQMPFIKVGAIIGTLLFAVMFIGRLVGSLLPGPVATVIRIGLVLGVGLFIFKSYSAQVVDAFAKIKSESDVAQKAVDKRSERIQKQTDP